MININNYFQNTQAIFKYKDSFTNDDFFKWTKYGYKTSPQYRIKQMVKESLSLGENDKLVFSFLSFNKLFKSFSCYLILNDKKLIRISNHWSNSNLKVNKCGWIRSCYWEIKGNKAKNKNVKTLQMWVVDFAKMSGVSNEAML